MPDALFFLALAGIIVFISIMVFGLRLLIKLRNEEKSHTAVVKTIIVIDSYDLSRNKTFTKPSYNPKFGRKSLVHAVESSNSDLEFLVCK
jgi:hypothetical protein